MLKLLDQFKDEVKPGAIYGLSNEQRSKLIPHEFSYCLTSGDLLCRRAKSSEPWRAVYDQDAILPKFCFRLNADYSEMTVDPDEAAPVALPELISSAESQVMLLQSELQKIEEKLCDAMGVAVGDGSDLSDEIMMFVYDPDGSSPEKLLRVYNEHQSSDDCTGGCGSCACAPVAESVG